MRVSEEKNYSDNIVHVVGCFANYYGACDWHLRDYLMELDYAEQVENYFALVLEEFELVPLDEHYFYLLAVETANMNLKNTI